MEAVRELEEFSGWMNGEVKLMLVADHITPIRSSNGDNDKSSAPHNGESGIKAPTPSLTLIFQRPSPQQSSVDDK